MGKARTVFGQLLYQFRIFLTNLLHVVAVFGVQHLAFDLAADLSTESGCEALAESCSGTIPDILVNNAGIAAAGRLDHVPRDRWESIMQLNLLAPMRLCNRFLPGMVERGSGHIVNISSLAGWVGARGMSPYCASKFGVVGLTESLAEEVRPRGIKVQVIFPDAVDTALWDQNGPIKPEHALAPERVADLLCFMVTQPPDTLIVAPAIAPFRTRRRKRKASKDGAAAKSGEPIYTTRRRVVIAVLRRRPSAARDGGRPHAALRPAAR